MKLKYLGTAAAEGWPAVFCRCAHCDRARAAGGKNIRTRSQAIINEDMLIDFPSDANMHMLQNNIDYSAVKYLLVTHPHSDHFAPLDLGFRSEGCYGHNFTEPTLVLAGPKSVIDYYNHYYSGFADEAKSSCIQTLVMENYKPYTFGNYTVTPLRANHMNGIDACCYHITDGAKHLLYLHDTGLLFDDVMDYLIENKVVADMVSFDCTYVTLPSAGGHMGLDTNIVTRDLLRQKGVITEKTKLCINHFSHNGGLIYDELVPVAAEQGFLTSYDGMEVEF